MRILADETDTTTGTHNRPAKLAQQLQGDHGGDAVTHPQVMTAVRLHCEVDGETVTMTRAHLASSKLQNTSRQPGRSLPDSLTVPFSRAQVEAWVVLRNFLSMNFADYAGALQVGCSDSQIALQPVRPVTYIEYKWQISPSIRTGKLIFMFQG